MRLGCCSWSHHRAFESGATNLLDWMAHCAADLKVCGIEITDGHLASLGEDYLREVTRMAVDLQLTISALTISNNFGLPTEAARERELEKIERALEACKELGTSMLRVFAGWPDGPKDVCWDEMVRCMKIAALLGERYGVVLAVENHNHGGFLQTAADVSRLFHETDSQWLRLNLDTGNYIDGFASIEKTLVYTVHIHAKMLDIAPSGEDKTTDYPALIQLLSDVNYRGFVSVEYEGEEDEFAAVKRGVNYLRRLIRAAEYKKT